MAEKRKKRVGGTKRTRNDVRNSVMFQQQEKNITEMETLSFSPQLFLQQNVSAKVKYRNFKTWWSKQEILDLARNLLVI